MATVYKIEIETVSPWTSFDEKTIKAIFEELLAKRVRSKLANVQFESTKVNVKRLT